MYEYCENVNAQTRWVRQLTWDVVRHAAGEEIVVYRLPATL